MKERLLPEIQQRILRLLPGNDREALRDAIFDLDMYCLMLDTIPEDVFSFLEETLFTRMAHESKHSSSIFYFFDSKWRHLNSGQKVRLLRLIKENYSHYSDWMSWFTVSEILGECFSNRRSLAVTKHLQRTCKKKGPRSMIPHAFEHHVTDSPSLLVRQIALRELKRMKNDPLDKVRREAEISLKRVKTRRLSRLSFMPLLPRKAP